MADSTESNGGWEVATDMVEPEQVRGKRRPRSREVRGLSTARPRSPAAVSKRRAGMRPTLHAEVDQVGFRRRLLAFSTFLKKCEVEFEDVRGTDEFVGGQGHAVRRRIQHRAFVGYLVLRLPAGRGPGDIRLGRLLLCVVERQFEVAVFERETEVTAIGPGDDDPRNNRFLLHFCGFLCAGRGRNILVRNR